ncbi:MAG: osmosensitive channel signal transduction histidine kinase [Phenylobacterium sp.]|nr:osmosensitive channel signal transduction histidine kinase [Phenylobacterium sp.]
MSSVFLAGVLITAYWLGSGPAYFASALSFLAFNFFILGGRATFSFVSWESLVTLVMFFATAMLTGSLTGRVRDEAEKALARARTTQTLFDATRDFSASPDEAFIHERLARHLAAAARGSAVVLSEGAIFTAPDGLVPSTDLVVQVRALGARDWSGGAATSFMNGWTFRPLGVDGAALGVAAWRPQAGGQHPAEEQTLLEILADTGAAAIARARLAAAKANAEARARTEELRNALLSSISHDLRTPLAAIMASASSLQEFGDDFDAATRRDLTATIQEESERMNAFVANLLNMTKLEAGALAVQRTRFGLHEVVDRTLRRQQMAHRRTVLEAIHCPDLEASGDPVLFEQALGNVVENAIRYSPAGSTVRIVCERTGGQAVVRVTDEGPGVPAQDMARIFDKFYRSPSVTATAGTGLGLSIARGFMEAMGGVVTAANRPMPERGLAVTLTLGLAA